METEKYIPRSTNVYEERGKRGPFQLWTEIDTGDYSAGIAYAPFREEPTRKARGRNLFVSFAKPWTLEAMSLKALPRIFRPHRKYVIDHLLPQIAFDLWPIILAAGAICVMERTRLMDSNDYGWFTIWHILFEATSGYATVGISFGNPFSTASFSGSFRKISKLIVSMPGSNTSSWQRISMLSLGSWFCWCFVDGTEVCLPQLIGEFIFVEPVTLGSNRSFSSATMLPVEYLRLNTDDREKAEEERLEDVQRRRTNEVRDTGRSIVANGAGAV
jgi:hypothetical protein